MNNNDHTGKKKPAPRAAPKAPDPVWVWAERHALDRHRESDARTALGEEAAAQLRLLRKAASNFAAQLPSIDEWSAFLAREIIPVYNSISLHDRMCAECGSRFAVGPRAAASSKLCSERCREREESRERARRSEAEKLQRKQERLETRMKSCRACAAGDPCAKHESERTRYESDSNALWPRDSGETAKITIDNIAGLVGVAKPGGGNKPR